MPNSDNKSKLVTFFAGLPG